MKKNLDKQNQVRQLTLELESRFGTGALRTAKSLIETAGSRQVIKTGFSALDKALGGGIPRDCLTEITATATSATGTSGMRTLAIKLLANAQAERDDVVYIDYAHSFAPMFAHEQGVDCDNLLLVRPDSHDKGLSVAHTLLTKKAAGLLIYDAGEFSPELLRTFKKLGAQINTALADSGCALVCLVNNGRQVAPPLSTFTTLRLHMERIGWLHKLDDVVGYRVRVHIEQKTTASVEIVMGVGEKK